MPAIAQTPPPPYYAVIFTSRRTEGDNGYHAMGEAMAEMAAIQPGYLGADSARDASCGITVSYWRDEASIKAWKAVAEHRAAQRLGIDRWYGHYEVRVAKVHGAYSGPEGRA